MRFSPVGLLFDDGKKITPVADVEDQVYLLTRHSGNDRLFRFSALLILSAVIATGGVLLDSTATVIGAMIVAPLAWPIQGVGLAIVQARIGQVQRSASILGFAVIAVVVVGLLIALAVPDELSPISNSQIAARTAPNLLDLFVAIATGTVGAFAVSRSVHGALLDWRDRTTAGPIGRHRVAEGFELHARGRPIPARSVRGAGTRQRAVAIEG